MTGARVEIGEVHVDLLHTRLQLGEIRVADPDSPMKNLFETEQMSLDLDTAAALRKKLVVREGALRGIVLNTRRGTSGALDPEKEKEPNSSEIWKKAADRGEAWLKDSAQQLQQNLEGDLQTVQLARELSVRWPQEYERLKGQSKQIERQARQVRDQVKQIADQPMDHLEQIQPTLAQIEQLRRDLLQAREELPRLQQQIRSDQTAVVRAKEHDEQYIRDKLKIAPLDGQELTDYLLGPVWAERIQTALDWIQWTREVVPTEPPKPTEETQPRGLTVLFPGYHSTPDLLVQKLNVSGGGTAQGSPFTFQGVLQDLTHQPRRHSRPAVLQLESQGAIRMLVKATFDRHTPVARDHLQIDVPAWRQSEQVLGNPGRFALTLAAGAVQIHADVRVEQDQVTGEIQVRQEQLQIQPQLSAEYARYVSVAAIEAAVDPIQRLETKVEIRGRLKRPTWRLQSNLGPQLAVGLEQAVHLELAARQEQLLSIARQQVDEELARVQQKLAAQHREILEQLELGDQQLEQLKRQLLADIKTPDQLIGQGRKLLERWKR